MVELTALNTLTLGNTFGTWYARTNNIIQRLNILKTASITGGDGVLVSANPAIDGGFTVEMGSSVSKNVTFGGNVTILGTLSAAFNQSVTGVNITVPYDAGVTLGNIVYLDSDGIAQKAKADDECTAEVLGIVVGFTGTDAQVATSGKVSGSSVIGNFLGSAGATLQKGVVYFLSEGITGAGTTIEPSVVDYVSKPVLLGLTADSGIILPYRGFIATYGLSGGSSTTVVQGVCGSFDGVYSVNGITAAIWSGSQSAANQRITGHIHAVNSFNLDEFANTTTPPVVSRIALFNNNYPETAAITSSSYTANTKRKNILYSLDPHNIIGTFKKTSSGTTNVNKTSKYFKDFSNGGYLYSTTGISGDVYRMSSIKITLITCAYENAIGFGTPNINFTINRQLSPISGTNISENDLISGGMHSVTTTWTTTDVVLEMRMKEYAVFGKDTGNGPTVWSYHTSGPITVSPELFVPVIRKYPVGIPAIATGVTASTVDGTENSSGTYPIIRKSNLTGSATMYMPKTYVWNFNNVELNSTILQQYIANTLRQTWYPYGVGGSPVPLSGMTMESAVIGWLAGLTHENGAISENVHIQFPSLFSALKSDTIETRFIGPISLNVELEMFKYNPFNGTTSGNPIIVNKLMSYDYDNISIAGRQGNSIGS